MTRTSISHRPGRIKHVPQRTCVACRKVKPKRELIRLVRVPDGSVEVDTTGKKAGRGAYLCEVPECWEVGLKGDRLGNVLRVKLTQENRERLIRNGGDLLQGVN